MKGVALHSDTSQKNTPKRYAEIGIGYHMEPALNATPPLNLKASLHPFTLLELQLLDIEAITQDLEQRLKQRLLLFSCRNNPLTYSGLSS